MKWTPFAGPKVASHKRANKVKYPTAVIAEVSLDLLVSAGLGAWLNLPMGKAGGRPARAFVPYPAAESDSRQNPTEPTASESDSVLGQADTTQEATTTNPTITGASEVVSGFVGCLLDDSGRKEALQIENTIKEFLSGQSGSSSTGRRPPPSGRGHAYDEVVDLRDLFE